MNVDMLRKAYDCVIGTKVEYLPYIAEVLNIYLQQTSYTLASEKQLIECMEIICEKSNNVGMVESFDELISSYKESIAEPISIHAIGIDENYEYYVNIYNSLINIINNRKDYINCSHANCLIPCIGKLIQPEVTVKEIGWFGVCKCELPKVGVPVLVAITNGCVGIDWVNEPGSITPFAHYNVVGWLPLIGEHFEIKKKEVVL